MAVNAFTLFGEITVDTKKMQQALRDANKSLQDTKKAMEALNDVTAKNIPITNGAAKGEDNHKRGLKGSGEAARQKAKDMDALGKKMGGVGDKMQSFGTDMTYLVTAPILAAGAAALKTAIDFDRVQNQVNAAAGSFEAGAVQFQRLINIARTSPGVFVKSAASAYALLKQMEGLSDPSIEKSLKAMGRIKLANPEFDATEFARNLNQLITQGFEAQDVKQAMGRLPAFGPMLAEKFKLSGSDFTTVAKEMRQLVLQGKITGDEFMNAFGDAVLTHPIYSKLDDTLGDKFLKTFERIELALKPIGDRIGAVLLPAFTGLAMQIEKISAAFATLSPEMQNAIIGLATFVAAIGPVAGVVGTLIGVFAALLASIKFIAAFFGVTLTVAFLPFIKVVAIVVAAVAALAAIAYVAYQAYATNFAGIGDAINDVARILKELAAVSFDVLVGAIRPIVDALGDLWRENGKEIEYVISGIVLVLTALAYAVGQALIQFTKFVGTLMKLGGGIVGMLIDQFSLLIGVITDVGRFIVAVFTGDWKKASESAKNIVRGFAQWIGSFLGTIPGIIIGALQALFPEMERFFSDLRDKVIGFAYAVGGEWGGAIVDGIVNGIFGGAGRIAAAVASASAGAQPTQMSLSDVPVYRSDEFSLLSASPHRKRKGLGGMSGGNGSRQATKEISDYEQTLQSLRQSLLRLNEVTNEQRIKNDILLGTIKNLKEGEEDRLLTEARALDSAIARKKAIDDFTASFIALKEELLPAQSALQKLNETLTDPKVLASLKEQDIRFARLLASIKDMQPILEKIQKSIAPEEGMLRGLAFVGDGIAALMAEQEALSELVAPPPAYYQGEWDKFFRVLYGHIGKLKEELPDFATGLANAIDMGLRGIGDVFGRAVAEWDGTAQGFFRSLAQGFRQLIQQIIQELIRLMVMRAVTSIIGAVGGSIGGSGSAPNPSLNHSTGLLQGSQGSLVSSFISMRKAAGGYIQGPGTGTSDSIPAMLSNGEFVIPARSVQKFGVDFFEALRKGQMPMRRYAMGGLAMPSASSMSNTSNSTSNYNNVFNISVPAGAGQQPTATMVQKSVLDALRKHEKRNK